MIGQRSKESHAQMMSKNYLQSISFLEIILRVITKRQVTETSQENLKDKK